MSAEAGQRFFETGLEVAQTLGISGQPPTLTLDTPLTIEPTPTAPTPTVHTVEAPAPTVPAPTVPAPTVPAPTVPAPTVPAPTVPAPTVPAPTVGTEVGTAADGVDTVDATSTVPTSTLPTSTLPATAVPATAVPVGTVVVGEELVGEELVGSGGELGEVGVDPVVAAAVVPVLAAAPGEGIEQRWHRLRGYAEPVEVSRLRALWSGLAFGGWSVWMRIGGCGSSMSGRFPSSGTSVVGLIWLMLRRRCSRRGRVKTRVSGRLFGSWPPRVASSTPRIRRCGTCSPGLVSR